MAYLVYQSFFESIISPLGHLVSSLLNGRAHLIFLVIVLTKTLVTIFSKTAFLFKLKKILLGSTKLALFFMVVWGFFYSHSTLPHTPELSPQQVKELYVYSFKRCNAIRPSLNLDNKKEGLDGNLKKELNQLLYRYQNERLSSVARDKFPIEIRPSGALRKLGISGIYFPFTAECLYDNSALQSRAAFTYAHEYFHGTGVTGEDECNFLAYDVLSKSTNAQLQYAAYLELFLTTKFLCGLTLEDTFSEISTLTQGDILEIRKNNQIYKTWFHKVSSTSNDLYLKLLSDNAGLASYDNYVKWVKMD